ncbi:uncharacterized protein LOC111594954 [Drosophila hydei]|uniref:Uncharacterized protein LOC111594954 n=1 Tax=Drosophila hydei TaxID=7224 RepID=A0A6J1LDI9_DROHY|nr:uncharacterized protein LOC111594954 [Drosophila hydei]
MEAKFLASALSFLSIFLAVHAQSFASIIENDSDESSEFALATTPIVYYGDAIVNIGEPFSITCVIPITERIHWLKNGESITRHNLRHGHDEHSYTLSESAIEGEKHKIEAHLKVRHALKVHEGRYQCNNNKNHRRDSGFHMLHVHSKQQQSGTPTESGYRTIDELTPSSADEIFTRTWQEQQLPQHSESPSQSSKQHNQQGNATSHSFGFGSYEQPATTRRYNELSTWHATTTADGQAGVNGIHRIYSATPPDFPPPRLSVLEHTVAPPEPPTIQLYNQTLPIYRTPIDTATVHHRAQHHQQQLQQQQQQQQQLNNFQLPLPPQPKQPTQHHNEKYQTYAPHFVPPAVGGGGGSVTTAPTALTTSYSNNFGLMQQQPKTILPIKKGEPHTHTRIQSSIFGVVNRPDSLVPNYDHVERQLKFYDIRTPLVLSCNVKNVESEDPLIWKKNGVNVTDDSSLRGRFKLIQAERKFIIDRAEPHDDGLYSCEFKGVSKDINVIARVVVRVPSNTGVVEGEKMLIPCTVLGSNPQLSWSFGNYTNVTNSTGRYILKADDNKIENAILMIENVTLEDRGDYKCHGRNEANDYANSTVATDVVTVRVKGKFAALWPFLGICAEVLILCLIILIYEKRRNKSELEESDTDPQEQKKKRRNYD